MTFGNGQNNSVTNLVNIVWDDIGDRGLTLKVDFWKECVERACQLSPGGARWPYFFGWQANKAKGLVISNRCPGRSHCH